MSSYQKPHLTFNEQLNLLKSRGLAVTDDNAALDYLRRLGYYRLSGYLHPFRQLEPTKTPQQRNDTFIPGAKFQDAVELYVFDKKLRLLLLDAIERIEVAIRVEIAYLLGKKDPFAYNNPNFLHGNFTKKVNSRINQTNYQIWQKKHEALINSSKEEFVKHFKQKYGLPLPIWVAIELCDFGLLSTFYQGMTNNDKTFIAQKYNIPSAQILESWLRCINYVRNIAAHHSRLWNKNLVDQPKLAKAGEMPNFEPAIANISSKSRIYIVVCIIAHFLRTVCSQSSWPLRLKELVQTFPNINVVNIKDMGFPENWEFHEFWGK